MRPSSDYVEALERMALGLAVIRLEVRQLRLRLAWKAGFRPSQLRIPRGRPGGGRWTEEGGEVVLAQAGPRPPSSGRTRVGGSYANATLRQQAELAASQAAADAAVARVRERQPNWRPPSGLYETVEGAINHNNAIVREAEARLVELMRLGIGPGKYAAGSVPAQGPGHYVKPEVRQELNHIGSTIGCHTCGLRISGTKLGNFIADHQLPTAVNPLGYSQRLFPQCATCSNRQGAHISNMLRSRSE